MMDEIFTVVAGICAFMLITLIITIFIMMIHEDEENL